MAEERKTMMKPKSWSARAAYRIHSVWSRTSRTIWSISGRWKGLEKIPGPSVV